MEKVQEIRELEKVIVSDIKNANSIITIKKHINDRSNKKEERIASLHSLRRIFLHFIESGKLASLPGNHEKKREEFHQWLMQQFLSYQDILIKMITENDPFYQVAAIRTMLEFVRREHVTAKNKESDAGNKASSKQLGAGDNLGVFGARTYQSLMKALLSLPDIDFDVLIMLRDEVLCKVDCRYYTSLIIRKVIADLKSTSSSASRNAADTDSSVIVKNCLDVIRFVEVPDEELLSDIDSFLVPSVLQGVHGDDGLLLGDGGDDDSSGDEEEDNDGGTVPRLKAVAGRSSRGMKRVMDVPEGENKGKKRKRLSRSQQVLDLHSHQKALSKAWLALLSMPLTDAQHKLVLKHLPENVITVMTHPLLLADYLTESYERGGVVAVLALDSLFQLIVKFNLDYPKFFLSLYRLCTSEVFSAKYRGKFMKLLSMSLRSANLPAYLVASFVKRLSQLTLRVPTPSALFCIAQITWLLRKHPQCSALIHRHHKKDTKEDADAEYAKKFAKQSSQSDQSVSGEFDPFEEADLEKNNAMNTSLWEINSLSKHHLHTVATLAQALQSAAATSDAADAPILQIDDFAEHSYATLLEAEVSKAKKYGALAYKQPTKLFPDDDIARACFSFSS